MSWADTVKAMTLPQSFRLLIVRAIMVQTIVALPRGAIAAPKLPLNSRSSSTNNILLNTPIDEINLPNLVATPTKTINSPDFPPGPQPPAANWPVHLPYTDDDIWLIFSHYDHVDFKNDTQVEQALQKAIIESSDPHLRTKLMAPREYTWSQYWDRSRVAVQVQPARPAQSGGPSPKELGLAFGVWTSCLIAINRFRLAYPGVFPQFWIQIKPEAEPVYIAGFGSLHVIQWQGTAPDPSDAVALTKRSPLDGIIGTDNALPNNSASGTNLNGEVGASDLPPGPQPPQDPWYYDVRFSRPLTTLKFGDFEHEEGRNETEVEELIQRAIRDSVNPELHDKRMEPCPYTWSDNGMRLFLYPQPAAPAEDPPHELLGLTYGIWEYCLTGINQFRLAYPGLYFTFEIWVNLREEELYLGVGGLLGPPTLQGSATTNDDAVQLT